MKFKNIIKELDIENIKKILKILIYRLSLDIMYITIISKYFNSDFALNITFYKYVISIIITCTFAIPVYNLINLHKPSNIIITLFNLMYFIPGMTLYALRSFSDSYFAFFCIYWLFILFLQYKMKLTISKEKITKNKITDYRFIIGIILIFIIVSFVIAGVYTNFKLNFSLENVYTLRKQAEESNVPVILEYLRTWATRVIPIGLAITLLKKKKMLSCLLIFSQLLLFSFDGLRSSLFILFFVILTNYFINEKSYKLLLPVYTLFGVFLNIIGVIGDKCTLLMSLLYRRMMFVPALLGNYYYDFFSIHEKLFLRQSVLGKLGFSNPYNLNVGNLIAKEYFNKVTMNSCTGLLGDAFSNFGWISLLFYPLMIILVLKILDISAQGLDKKIYFVVCVELFNNFTNGSFFTELLTGGFLIIVLVFMLFPKDDTINGEQDLYMKYENKVLALYEKLKKKIIKHRQEE